MLRKFKININDKSYDVEMEEMGTPQQNLDTASAPQINTMPASSAVATLAPTSTNFGEGEPTLAPMPGTIIDIRVKVGDQIVENQVLLVLEAMKMENEIVATKSGTVAALHVIKGEAIDVGNPMITIV
ncbi:biotin/lipoyl-containing protein [Carnobacterium pleistocenium]|uniref:biotin/lipoyl-containing protein n=1 Tax=Carnobacterium pleistocenium TaxID=181073 RepID=UPI000552F5B3|nr:biotin/lipoyl-containing protein [Carnobacterium pleistocenium]